MANTPHGFYYPTSADPYNPEGDIQSLATSIDNLIDEISQDAVGSAISAGTQTNGAVVTYNDGTNSIDFSMTQDLRASASPSFDGLTLSGIPTAPTAAINTNSTQIATTAFVINQAYLTSASAASIYATKSGNLSQFAATTSAQLAGVLSDETGSGSAVFSNSPTLTGIPVAPTAAVNTNTTQVATTAFVMNQNYMQWSSSATFVTAVSASNTYLTQVSASNTYLTKASASTTYAGIEQYDTYVISNEQNDLTSGSSLYTTRAPYALTLTANPRAFLSVGSSSGSVGINVFANGSSIFTNILRIDENEKTSVTAESSPTLAITSVPDDAEITFDVVNAGTGAKGLKITLYHKRA